MRHFAFPGYVDWTGDGQLFAWRMKIQNRTIEEMTFALFDLDKKEIHRIDPKNFLNNSQYQELALHPRTAIQFAEYLQLTAKQKLGIKNSEVKCKIKVVFNGSKPSYIFDPNQDLISGSKKFKYFDSWIMPLPKPEN